MDGLLILLVGALVAAALWSWLARRHAPPRGRRDHGVDPLGRRSAREIVEGRAALEAEDLAQLLEVHNARRRRRGEAEHTVADVELLVASDMRERTRDAVRHEYGAARPAPE